MLVSDNTHDDAKVNLRGDRSKEEDDDCFLGIVNLVWADITYFGGDVVRLINQNPVL